MTFPKVSIIIISWDGLKYLKQNLPKILALNYPDYEVIIVDNGSVDGTDEYLAQLSADMNRSLGSAKKTLKIVKNEENVGTSKARNQGAQKATGDFFLFLDNDIDIRDDREILQKLITQYEKLENPAFILVPLIDIEKINELKTRKYGAFYTLYGIKRNPEITIEQIQKWANPVAKIATCFSGDMFISKKVWDDLGGFDESQKFNSDDDDIGTRATVYGYVNYLYGKDYFLHLGEERRRDNRQYASYYKLSYSGKARAIIKNMQFRTIIYMLPIYTAMACAVGLKQSLQRFYPGIFFAFFSSFFRFLKWLPDSLRERKKIQNKRKVGDREFLRLKYEMKK